MEIIAIKKERDHYKKQYEDAEIVITALKKTIGQEWKKVEKLESEIKDLEAKIEDLETTIRVLSFINSNDLITVKFTEQEIKDLLRQRIRGKGGEILLDALLSNNKP